MILMLFLSSTLVLGGDSSSSVAQTQFNVAFKLAESNLDLPGGEKYDEDFGVSCGPWLAVELPRCTSECDSSQLRDLTFLFRVGRTGKIEELLVEPDTKVADCLKPVFLKRVYPNPPGKSWWVRMSISISD